MNFSGPRPVDPGALVVVTLNTWKGEGDYARRIAAMAELLDRLAPDVVLLQEVFAIPERGINTAHALASRLGLHAVYHPAREKFRKFNGVMVICQSGMAVLSRPRFLGSRAVTLPTDARDGERIAQVASLDAASPVAVLNLHLSHLGGEDALRRRQCAAALRALMREEAALRVVGGDFNDRLDAAWLAPLAAETGAELAPPPTDGLDHILTAGPCRAGAAEISEHGDAAVSDHPAVRAVVRID